jgi:CubicO group peptidase (beta-lactamase class C family)
MKRSLVLLLSLCLAAVLVPAAAQTGSTAPGETSGVTLSPLRVSTEPLKPGELRLTYQSACGATDNNIYFGRLEDVATHAWSGAVCGIGSSGVFEGFDPGAGSYFFIVAGNGGVIEGSYGDQDTPTGGSAPRPAFVGNPCGEVQQLTDTCNETPAGASCVDSSECGSRQECVAEPTTGLGQCRCLPPYQGPLCNSCQVGYAGDSCSACDDGFVESALDLTNGDDEPPAPRAPSNLVCEPDVPGSCSGVSCSGHGTCTVDGRFGVCVCDEGYTGSDCGECAPDYERDPLDRCVLGGRCRDAKCGGHGDCVALEFGDVACVCDAGFSGVDCGGPDLQVTTTAERRSLYEGETLVLDPPGSVGPYTWSLVDPNAPARLVECGGPTAAESVERLGGGGGCLPGGAELTIVFPPGGPPTLTLVAVSVSDGAGNQAFGDFLALPPTDLPITGEIHDELLPYYEAMLRYMRVRGIRAGALAISKGGKIVGSNGYGYRDAGIDANPWVNAGDAGPLVQPDSPFRLASISKTLTAAAVRDAANDAGVNITSDSPANRAASWVEDSIGFSLTGGAPTFDYNLEFPLTTDDRWARITIQHLLNHHAGFRRDVVSSSTHGHPKYDAELLPFTEDLQDPQQLQTARWGASSKDISYANMYAIAALGLDLDPRPTVEQTIRFASGVRIHYPPGGTVPQVADNYSNLGYILAGRVLEGLRGRTYDPDDPAVPDGWGAFAELLQDYLCEASGITGGVYPGDAFNPQPLEPYYRNLDWQGVEGRAWNLAEGSDKIRWNEGIQQWQFCQSNCPDLQGAVWNDELNTPDAYGGFWLAQRNSAGGVVATAPTLLRFARNHRIRVGTPNQSNSSGIGALLANPGNHGWSSSHSGSLRGTSTLLWQMGGDRTNQIPADFGAWLDDPTAPVVMGQDGKVKIQEITFGNMCTLPGDVTVAALFNQRQDQRAPRSNVSDESTSDASNVYNRIVDFLADATCQVDSQGWPEMAEPGAQLQAPLVCP